MGFNENTERNLTILLIEDDKTACDEIRNYVDDHCSNVRLAGITNNVAKYEYKSFNGQWNYVKLAGFISELAHKKYAIKVRLIGATVELYINNIKLI